jgi:hypothetical protein
MYASYLEHCSEYGEKQTTLDRIDVNGNYELANVRWATKAEQSRNTRNTIVVEYRGLIVAFPYICDCFNLKYDTVYAYLASHKGESSFEELFDKYLDMKGL